MSSLGRRLLLAIPFLLVAAGAVGARRLVPRLGDRIAKRLSATSNALRLNRPPTLPWKTELNAGTTPSPLPSYDAGASADGATPAAVHVPAALVQRAIDDQGAHVRGTTIRAADGSARGVRLGGVSSLGLGLEDGDVLIAIDGQPALDEQSATDLALAAVAREHSELHATALRGEIPFAITLDLPPSSERRLK